jgi:hypothetical protein
MFKRPGGKSVLFKELRKAQTRVPAVRDKSGKVGRCHVAVL